MSIQSAKEMTITRINDVASTSENIEDLSFAAAALAKLAETTNLNGINDVKALLIDRLNLAISASTSLEAISYATAALSKLEAAGDDIIDSDTYTIGTPGTYGFGVGALRDADIPAGWTATSGHNDQMSPNYGNYFDPDGSQMVFIPKFWFKWSGNTPLVSKYPAAGYVAHEAFRHCTKGFFHDKCHVSNVDGKAIAKIGEPPLSTSAANNPISALTVAPTNTYAGMITAIIGRTATAHAETVFEANAIAVLALAHAEASTNTSVCAYKDVLPYMPKGNNNNALGDINDNSVSYMSAGNATYPACALTGSGFPFAKTTHNGQACGVADVNGNMWRVNIGLTKLNDTDAIFKILKTTVSPDNITASNLHDAALYDDLDLTGLVDGNDGWIRFGNGAEQVFDFGATELELRRACAGLPLLTGVSAAGTNQFGQDGLYRYWRMNLLPLSGATWDYVSDAGVFARHLGTASSSSSNSVGGSACVSL